MEEDVLGTQQDIVDDEYVVCSRCGTSMRRADATIVPGDALEDRSEYEYLCHDCELALADGERDLPTSLE